MYRRQKEVKRRTSYFTQQGERCHLRSTLLRHEVKPMLFMLVTPHSNFDRLCFGHWPKKIPKYLIEKIVQNVTEKNSKIFETKNTLKCLTEKNSKIFSVFVLHMCISSNDGVTACLVLVACVISQRGEWWQNGSLSVSWCFCFSQCRLLVWPSVMDPAPFGASDLFVWMTLLNWGMFWALYYNCSGGHVPVGECRQQCSISCCTYTDIIVCTCGSIYSIIEIKMKIEKTALERVNRSAFFWTRVKLKIL